MSIVDLIFPKICAGCGGEGEYICKKCQGSLVRPDPICPMCSMPSLDGWTHTRCKKKYGMERLIVGLPYRGMVQDCLKKVKYKSSWDIIKFLYDLCRFPCLDNSVVVSVPMWKVKERERGFNQADIIARLVAEKNKVPYLVFLERIRETKPMFGLDRKKRKINIDGAFEISEKGKVRSDKSNRVILIDDVWTTGSTMRECSRVLKKAGVTEIWGVAMAR